MFVFCRPQDIAEGRAPERPLERPKTASDGACLFCSFCSNPSITSLLRVGLLSPSTAVGVAFAHGPAFVEPYLDITLHRVAAANRLLCGSLTARVLAVHTESKAPQADKAAAGSVDSSASASASASGEHNGHDAFTVSLSDPNVSACFGGLRQRSLCAVLGFADCVSGPVCALRPLRAALHPCALAHSQCCECLCSASHVPVSRLFRVA